jgi:hypothetical protein
MKERVSNHHIRTRQLQIGANGEKRRSDLRGITSTYETLVTKRKCWHQVEGEVIVFKEPRARRVTMND